MDHDASTSLPPTWRGVGAEEPRPTARGGVRPAFAAKTTTPSPPVRACSVGGRPVFYGVRRTRAARHGVWKLRSRCFNLSAADLAQCRCGRASANGEGCSAARVCRQGNHAKCASACLLRGRSASTGRRVRGPRGMGFDSCGQDRYILMPPTWRGVDAEEPRPTVWGGARRALAEKTTTPSAPARECSVGGRTVLHGAKRARAARLWNWKL